MNASRIAPGATGTTGPLAHEGDLNTYSSGHSTPLGAQGASMTFYRFAALLCQRRYRLTGVLQFCGHSGSTGYLFWLYARSRVFAIHIQRRAVAIAIEPGINASSLAI